MGRMWICALIVLGLMLPQTLWAQAYSEERVERAKAETGKTDYEVFSLGDIVVSAEQGESYKLTVKDEFTAEDIRNVNAHTLLDALDFMPGFVVDEGRKNQGVTMNGMGMTRVLVLIDGVPFYETAYRTLDLNQIPASVISKIEVIKGNASVLYGPNAQAGVINVVTKKGTELAHVSGYFEAGRYDTYNMGASAGGSYGLVNGWLSVDHRTSNGWRMSGDFEPKLGGAEGGGRGNWLAGKLPIEDGGKRDESDNEITTVWGRIGVDLAPNSEYYVSMHYVDRNGGVPASIDSNMNRWSVSERFTQLNRWDKYSEFGMDVSGKQEIFNNFVVTGKVYYHYHEDRYESWDFAIKDPAGNWVSSGQRGNWGAIFPWVTGPVAPEDFKLFYEKAATSRYLDTILGTHFIADWKINDMHTIRGSIQYRQDVHKQTAELDEPFAKYTSYTGSAGAEYQLSLMDNHLGVVLGVSYDWFNVDKGKFPKFDGTTGNFTNYQHPSRGLGGTTGEWNPMVGVNFMFPEYTGFLAGTELYASVGQKTRFPTLREHASSNSANPNLEPEKSINYILGMQRSFWDGMVTVGLDGFYFDIRDMIVGGTDPYGASMYVNQDKVSIYGVSFNLGIQPGENVRLGFNYTYGDGRNRSKGRLSNDVEGIYEHSYTILGSWYIPEIGAKVTGNVRYVGNALSRINTSGPNEYTGQRFLVGFGTSKYLFNDTVEIYGHVSNVFDEDWGEGYPGHGREFILGTRVTF